MGGIMPKTLLLADDSVTIQKVVGISFANEDVKLVTVDNGDDALAQAREVRPDIVLADVVMPGMNGYEVCEAIKSDAALRHVPVLLLTGTFEAYDEERAQRAGADGHVTKPFEAQALVDLVNARLAEAAAAPSSAAPETDADANAFDTTAGARDGGLDLFDEVTAPSGTVRAEPAPEAREPAVSAPGPSGAAPDASQGGPDFGRSDDAFARPGTGRGEGSSGFDVGEEAADAFAFEAPDDVHDELSLSQRGPEPAPAGAEASASEATVALFDRDDEEDDAFANAETLPPVDSDLAEEDGDDPFAPTRLIEPQPAGPSSWPAEASPPAVTPEPEPRESFGAGGPGAAPWPSAEEELVGTASFHAPDSPFGAEAEDLDAPQAARDYDVSSSDLGDPFAGEPAAPFTAAPAAPAQPAAFEPQDEESAAAPFPSPESAPAEIPPVFRRQIQDALEKVAWEAFGDLAEKLVKDTLDRVERVAWEVVPQMAETLIQEEIRRLKAEEEDDGGA